MAAVEIFSYENISVGFSGYVFMAQGSSLSAAILEDIAWQGAQELVLCGAVDVNQGGVEDEMRRDRGDYIPGAKH